MQDACAPRSPAEENPWQLAKDFRLRVRARISWHFGASAGQADARRRDAGDVVISSRSGNAAGACPPPRPAAKCQIILARALRTFPAGAKRNKLCVRCGSANGTKFSEAD